MRWGIIFIYHRWYPFGSHFDDCTALCTLLIYNLTVCDINSCHRRKRRQIGRRHFQSRCALIELIRSRLIGLRCNGIALDSVKSREIVFAFLCCRRHCHFHPQGSGAQNPESTIGSRVQYGSSLARLGRTTGVFRHKTSEMVLTWSAGATVARVRHRGAARRSIIHCVQCQLNGAAMRMVRS